MRSRGRRARSAGGFALLVLVLPVLAACGESSLEPAAQTVTHTVTATATETVTEVEVVTVPAPAAAPTPTGDLLPDEATATAALPVFELSVLEDGCAVERSEGDADNLTWSVTDHLGVQVLGRNALGETSYRYFQPGEWSVVLEAWAGDRYTAVSNEVTVTC